MCNSGRYERLADDNPPSGGGTLYPGIRPGLNKIPLANLRMSALINNYLSAMNRLQSC